jgi:hypothetical protein
VACVAPIGYRLYRRLSTGRSEWVARLPHKPRRDERDGSDERVGREVILLSTLFPLAEFV